MFINKSKSGLLVPRFLQTAPDIHNLEFYSFRDWNLFLREVPLVPPHDQDYLYSLYHSLFPLGNWSCSQFISHQKMATTDKLNHFYLCSTTCQIWLSQLVFSGLHQLFLKWVHETPAALRSFDTNANSWALTQTNRQRLFGGGPRNVCFISPPGDSVVSSSLRVLE